MKIITNNGEGREKNPYYCESMSSYSCWELPEASICKGCHNNDDFEKSHPLLPIYDQSGKLFTGSGEVEADLVWQFLGIGYDCKEEWFDYDGIESILNETRQIYRIADHIEPTDQEKEEIKPSKTSNLIEKEKVIELLEAEMERVVGIIKKYAKYRMMDLTPLIREIKNLTN